MLSALLFLGESSTGVEVRELIERPDGRLEERRPPEVLHSRSVTVLDVYGDLYYAGARTLEELLPTPRGARNPAVVLRMRGRADPGATLVDVLTAYARVLTKVDGCLFLTGTRGEAYEQLAASSKLRRAGRVRIYEATPIIAESMYEAIADAHAWLAQLDEDES